MIRWTQQYALGIDDIDRQHRELFRRMNQLEEQLCEDDCKELVDDTLHFLLVYVNVHFHDEEKLMEQVAYPRVAEHRDEHGAFVERIQAMVAEERSHYNADDLRRVVIAWIGQHILQEDMAFRNYFEKQKSLREGTE